jgi:hypothetical protein
MDKKTVAMVKSLLKDIVSDKGKEVTSQIYHKFGGKEIVEERYCRQYCLNNTLEVRQAIKEHLSS